MKIKTTKEIKRQNDYAGKRWVEIGDIVSVLQNITEELGDAETQDIEDKEEENNQNKFEELKQMFYNLRQSHTANVKKMDMLLGRLITFEEEIKKNINLLNERFNMEEMK